MVLKGGPCGTWTAWSLLSACLFLSKVPHAVEISAAAGEVDCPRTCFCNTASKIVYCSRRGLSSIPEGIPVDSLQLNLNGNRMENPVLRRSNLSGFVELEHLYLSECAIEAIDVGAFGNLPDLKWLDLSNNQIKVLLDQTFLGLSLEHLFLNGNRNVQLLPGSFEGLGTIGLYLHDCSLARLRPEVLAPLHRTLKNLWLNGNELERLDRRFVELFSRLMHLRLGTNPLQCSCDAVWLKEFFDRSSDTFRGSLPPSCLSPRPLKGRYFSELSLFDLRCQMPQFTSIDGFFDTGSGRLRCAASGEPAPVLYWIQPSGKTSKFVPPLPSDSDDDDAPEAGTQNEATLTLTLADEDKGHLTGMYICVANNEAGNVTLSLTVPWPPPNPSTPHVLSTSGPPASTAVNSESIPPQYTRAMSTVATGVLSSDADPVDMQSRLFSDSLRGVRSTTVPSWNDVPSKGNYTHLEIPDVVQATVTSDVDERMFSLGELTWAVVGTHLLTLLLCFTVAALCRRARRKARDRKSSRPEDVHSVDYCNDEVIVFDKAGNQRNELTDHEDPVLSESVYLNAMRHHRLKYYMDPRPAAASDQSMIMR